MALCYSREKTAALLSLRTNSCMKRVEDEDEEEEAEEKQQQQGGYLLLYFRTSRA
jgi:hypothetical protein